jgi:hypothetical protein
MLEKALMKLNNCLKADINGILLNKSLPISRQKKALKKH